MVLVFLRSTVCQLFFLHASTNMHNCMAEKVLRANIVFFDSNPIGNITTRFSKDQTFLDMALPPILVLVTQGALRSITVVITVSIVNPWLLIPAVIGLTYMISTVKKGIPPMIDAQRFDQKFYGPINSTFAMVINGMVSLRAYRKFDFFRMQFMDAIEKSANSTFCYVITNRWLGIRLDACCILFGISTAAFAIFSRNVIDRELLTFSL
jgi:ABC-type multidrug transport system fused ATPase/permease subunit